MNIKLHHGDLPAGLHLGSVVAVDCEMGGLNPWRDRIFLTQIKGEGDDIHLVKFGRGEYNAPNLSKVLSDPKVTKIFHVARTDCTFLQRWLGVTVAPVFCTKVASRIARTNTDIHSMKFLLKEYLGVEVSKHYQCSDWGAEEYTKEQMEYAASDVLYLHALRDKLIQLLQREGRTDLAKGCFDFLPTRSKLDLYGWPEEAFLGHH